MKKLHLILTILLFIASPGIGFSQEKIDLLILNRNYEEALQLLNKRIQKDPGAALFLKKGLVLSTLQMYQEAISAYTAGLELEPDNKEIPAELADAYAALGNHPEANLYYKIAAELEPEDLSMAAKLGKNYIQLDDFKKAYDVFSTIYREDSTNVYWNKQYAFSAYRTHRTKQAVELYEKVIQMNPGDYSSYHNLIKLYQLMEKFSDKLRIVDLGLKQFPNDQGFFNVQASHYFYQKRYEEARGVYEKYFVAGGDSTFKTLQEYGISLYFTKDEQKAISILDICANQIVNDPYVLFYLALSYKKLAEYEVAEAYMNAAIESATPHYLPDMYHHLGQIYGQQRMFEESIAALKKANEMDPTNYEVLFEIATTYEEFNSNKTIALNYYNIYLKEAGEAAKNANYALERMTRIKEDLFFEE